MRLVMAATKLIYKTAQGVWGYRACVLTRVFGGWCNSTPAVTVRERMSVTAHEQVKFLYRRSESGCEKTYCPQIFCGNFYYKADKLVS